MYSKYEFLNLIAKQVPIKRQDFIKLEVKGISMPSSQQWKTIFRDQVGLFSVRRLINVPGRINLDIHDLFKVCPSPNKKNTYYYIVYYNSKYFSTISSNNYEILPFFNKEPRFHGITFYLS